MDGFLILLSWPPSLNAHSRPCVAQNAAGAFLYIRENIANSIPGVLPFDLTGGGLSMVRLAIVWITLPLLLLTAVCSCCGMQLINLMLAQAQSCYFERAVSTGTSSASLLAKIAKNAADLYLTAMRPLTVRHRVRSYSPTSCRVKQC